VRNCVLRLFPRLVINRERGIGIVLDRPCVRSRAVPFSRPTRLAVQMVGTSPRGVASGDFSRVT
jgi:hypothetical protein